jgi:hypothetical protein
MDSEVPPIRKKPRPKARQSNREEVGPVQRIRVPDRFRLAQIRYGCIVLLFPLRVFLPIQGEIMTEIVDLDAGTVFVGGGGEDYASPQMLLLKYANRHGLIAGATGTGKTVTLQTLAESFSRAGVPVFHGRCEGRSGRDRRPGDPNGKLNEPFQKRAAQIGSNCNTRAIRSPSGMSGANAAIRCAPRPPRWGRCCCRG